MCMLRKLYCKRTVAVGANACESNGLGVVSLISSTSRNWQSSTKERLLQGWAWTL